MIVSVISLLFINQTNGLLRDTDITKLSVFSTSGFDVISKLKIDAQLKRSKIKYNWTKIFNQNEDSWYLAGSPKDFYNIDDLVKWDNDLTANVFRTREMALDTLYFSVASKARSWKSNKRIDLIPFRSSEKERLFLGKCYSNFHTFIGEDNISIDVLICSRPLSPKRDAMDAFFSDSKGHIKRYQALDGKFFDCGRLHKLPHYIKH